MLGEPRKKASKRGLAPSAKYFDNFDKSLENTDLKLKETSENIFTGIEKFNTDFSNNMKEQLDIFINNNENYSAGINRLVKSTLEGIDESEKNNSKMIDENLKQIEKLNNELSAHLKNGSTRSEKVYLVFNEKKVNEKTQ